MCPERPLATMLPQTGYSSSDRDVGVIRGRPCTHGRDEDGCGAFYVTAAVPAVEPFPEAVHGENVCGSMWCYTGSEADFEAFIQEARDVAEPLFEMVGSMPYPALQSMVDALYPPGYQWYWKGDSLTELTDEAIAVNRQFAEVPTPKSGVHIYPTDGAVHRVAPDETAWRHRDVSGRW